MSETPISKDMSVPTVTYTPDQTAPQPAARPVVSVISSPEQVSEPRWRVQEALAMIGGFGLFALLAATIVQARPLLHPIFPLAALVFFLYPFRKTAVPRRLLQLGIALFVLWLLFSLSGVLFPFIVAFILAYLFSPIVDWARRRGIPRWVSTTVIVLMIPAAYALIGIFIVPGMLEQAETLIAEAKEIVSNPKTRSLLDREYFVKMGEGYGIDRATTLDFLTGTVEPKLKEAISWLVGSSNRLLANVATLLESVFNLLLIPILLFSFLKDFDRLRTWARRILLQDDPQRVQLVLKADGIVSGYLRGILLTSSNVGLIASIVFSLFDIPFAVVIGILTGVFNLIPIFGMFLNLGVAMIIYLFAPGSFWEHTIITAATIAGLHALNSYIIEPRVIGERVGLHSVLVIAALFVFGYFLGFLGMLIAVPATAVIQMLLKEWYANMQARRAVDTAATLAISTTTPAV